MAECNLNFEVDGVDELQEKVKRADQLLTELKQLLSEMAKAKINIDIESITPSEPE